MLYKYLYERLIDDPDADTKPHYAMELQIADLITVLSNPEWTDFRLAENHVVAEFFDSPDTAKKQQFLQQLLLAVELFLRIHSKDHEDRAKRRLLQDLPPKISWDLALAERWLENMSISKSCNSSSTKSTYSFDLRKKRCQKAALREFARVLKWPNIGALNRSLSERAKQELPVEDLSADTMSWFTGVILPGPSLPWLVMKSLIRCDSDTGDDLHGLSHLSPASGFQYRANTYWSSSCVVGKVLGGANGVKQVAGWIGPCHSSPDLKRTECVRIEQLSVNNRNRMSLKEVDQMNRRTCPLGPEQMEYPVAEFDVPLPDVDNITDTIRLEKLSFHPVQRHSLDEEERVTRLNSSLFRASIIFALGAKSCPLNLRYDVDFITAYPCHWGPHGKRLFL